MNQMLWLAVLAVLVVGPIQPAIAQLDIPGYVPCYPGSGGDLATTSPNPLTVTIDIGDQAGGHRGSALRDGARRKQRSERDRAIDVAIQHRCR